MGKLLSILPIAALALAAACSDGAAPLAPDGAALAKPGDQGAGNPHFQSYDFDVDGTGALLCTFRETGLGNTLDNADFTCAASTATAVYQCWNNGGKHPRAANKETVTSAVSSTETFPVRNGSASGTIRVAPPGPGSFSCPSGQTLYLESIEYSGITLDGPGSDDTVTGGPVSRSNLHVRV